MTKTEYVDAMYARAELMKQISVVNEIAKAEMKKKTDELALIDAKRISDVAAIKAQIKALGIAEDVV